MTSLQLKTSLQQQTCVSPRLQQSVRLLQLSSLDFSQELNAAADLNPFLERDDEAERGPEDMEEARDAEQPADADDVVDAVVDSPFDAQEEWRTGGSGAGSDGAESPEMMAGLSAPTSLADVLHRQLGLVALPRRDAVLAHAVADSLDDDGYLRLDELSDLIAVTRLSPPAGADELTVALRRVQSLEPAGVGARDLKECLALQLGAIACPARRALVGTIVEGGLELLARRGASALAAHLGRPLAEVEQACAALRSLDPRPGWRIGGPPVRHVVPDVSVRRTRSGWTVSLNPGVVPRLRLHRECAELYARIGTRAAPHLGPHLREARWLLQYVEQRFSTILQVARAVVLRQQDFLEHGPTVLKPLTLQEVAGELGVHESTVCRATRNKYMSTPIGVFELKYFFSRALTSSDGTAYSGKAVRGLVQEMLGSPNAGARLTDTEITRRLARRGYTVTRRTVTKYRHQLGVERSRVGT